MAIDTRRRLSKRKRKRISLTRVFLDGVDLDGACVKVDARRGLVVCTIAVQTPNGRIWAIDFGDHVPGAKWGRAPILRTRTIRGRVTFHKLKKKRKKRR